MSGFVLYPRSYDTENAVVNGVDIQERPWRVRLNVPGYLRKAQGDAIPKMEGFAARGTRSNNRCLAEDDNGPMRPAGILLAERCAKAKAGAIEDIQAGWMSVLRPGPDEPLPVTGIGYVEIAAWVDNATYRAASQNSENGAPPQLDVEHCRRDGRYRFTAVVLEPREVNVAMSADGRLDNEQLEEAIGKYFDKGHQGGALIRVHRDGVVDLRASATIRPYWMKNEGRMQNASEAISEFQRRTRRSLQHAAREGFQVTALPMLRISASPILQRKLRDEIRTRPDGSKTEKCWVEKSHQGGTLIDASKKMHQMATKIAVRRVALNDSNAPDGTGLGAARVYAYSEPLGNPILLEHKPGGVVRRAYRSVGDEDAGSPGSAARDDNGHSSEVSP